MLVQTVGLVIVPVAALLDEVDAVALCASGLVTGMAGALVGPAQRALVADLADLSAAMGGRLTAGQWLVWQDLAQRVSMIFAAPVGAWLVVAWGAQPLLWCETVLFLLGAATMLAVPAVDGLLIEREPDHEDTSDCPGTVVSVRAALSTHPEIAAGILLAGVGGLCWFGFSLGLAVLGFELGMPGALIAAGMCGYGGASIVTTLLAPVVMNRLPRTATMLTAWVVLGLAFVVIPMVAPRLVAIAIVAAMGGAAMPWGIAALNALISEQTTGAERRAAFTAEAVFHSGGTSVGLLIGGAIIGWAGAGRVLTATGIVQVVAAVASMFLVRRTRRTTHDHSRHERSGHGGSQRRLRKLIQLAICGAHSAGHRGQPCVACSPSAGRA
jgi:MFS family permease